MKGHKQVEGFFGLVVARVTEEQVVIFFKASQGSLVEQVLCNVRITVPQRGPGTEGNNSMGL